MSEKKKPSPPVIVEGEVRIAEGSDIAEIFGVAIDSDSYVSEIRKTDDCQWLMVIRSL